MRRLYLIVGIAIVLIGIASYVTWAFTRPIPAAESASGASTNLFVRLFPFGTGNAASIPNGTGTEESTPAGTPGVPRLREISAKPVAGGSPFTAGTTTIIRYVERETGHVYETPADSPTVTRISNTTIPRIEQVLWTDQDHLIASYLGDTGVLQNFYAALVPGKTEQSLNGSFIASWDRATLDASGKNLLAVADSANGARFTLSRPDGTNAKTIFTSPLKSWIPIESSKAQYAETAPSSGIPGYLYQIVNGALTETTGGIPGMLALPSPSGRYIAISSGSGTSIGLVVFDTKTAKTTPLPLATLAKKCVWVSENPLALVCGVPTTLPDGEYPDDWLLGSVSFTDDIWGIEPASGVTTLLADPQKEAGAAIDLWQPAIAGNYVTFVNKRDLSFWSFKFLAEKAGP